MPRPEAFGDVFERSVAAIAIEPVGQARGLADVEIVEAVVVDVGDRDSVVAVDVDAAGAVEHGAPVVGAMQQLGRVGRIAAERRGGDVDEDTGDGNGLEFRRLRASCGVGTHLRRMESKPVPSSPTRCSR